MRPDLSLPLCPQVVVPGWGSRAAAGAWVAHQGAGKGKSHFRPEWWRLVGGEDVVPSQPGQISLKAAV